MLSLIYKEKTGSGVMLNPYARKFVNLVIGFLVIFAPTRAHRILFCIVPLMLLIVGCAEKEDRSATKDIQAEESSEVVIANGTLVPEVIEGLWAGVFEIEKELVHLRVELKSEDEDIKLTVRYMLPGVPGVVGDVLLESSRVNFELTRDANTIAFDGRLQGDTITGVVEHAGESGTFGLVRWVQVDATLYDDYMGGV